MEKKINHSAVFVMKRGLVFGKFMPLHQGHLVLIDFALRIVIFYTSLFVTLIRNLFRVKSGCNG